MNGLVGSMNPGIIGMPVIANATPPLLPTPHDPSENSITLTYAALHEIRVLIEQRDERRRKRKSCKTLTAPFFGALGTEGRYYHVDFEDIESNDTTANLRFKCLPNYHRIDGDLLIQCLPNETLVGEEPRCVVNSSMEKKALSMKIAFFSFIFPALWLLADFFRFKRDRRSRRSVSFRPYTQRFRVAGLQMAVSRKEIAKDIMNAMGSSSYFREDNSAEDIFQNKTVTAKTSKKLSDQAQKHLQMIGAARAFGKLGRILTTDMF